MYPRIAFLVLALLIAAMPRAEQIEGLYEAEVVLSPEQLEHRGPAVREGFKQVLVKLAGSRAVLDNPTIAEAVAVADSYLLQFFYSSPTRQPGEDDAGQPLLHLSFQPAAMDALLRESGVGVLSANRPGVLMWMSVDEGGSPRILNDDVDAAASESLRRHAMRRGLPLLFPALDLEEMSLLDPQALAALDMEAVSEASQRYGAAMVVIAHFTRSADESAWRGQWRFGGMEELLDGSFEAAAFDEVAGKLVDFAAEAMAARYAIRAGADGSRRLRLRVEGVSDFANYRRLDTLLRQLVSVRELRLALVDGQTLVFELLTDTTTESLRQELGLLPQMRADELAPDLGYRWIGG